MRLCDTLEGDWREPPKKDSGPGVGDHGRDKLSCIAFLLSGFNAWQPYVAVTIDIWISGLHIPQKHSGEANWFDGQQERLFIH
jgi:hypothetical protein